MKGAKGISNGLRNSFEPSFELDYSFQFLCLNFDFGFLEGEKKNGDDPWREKRIREEESQLAGFCRLSLRTTILASFSAWKSFFVLDVSADRSHLSSTPVCNGVILSSWFPKEFLQGAGSAGCPIG